MSKFGFLKQNPITGGSSSSSSSSSAMPNANANVNRFFPEVATAAEFNTLSAELKCKQDVFPYFTMDSD